MVALFSGELEPTLSLLLSGCWVISELAVSYLLLAVGFVSYVAEEVDEMGSESDEMAEMAVKAEDVDTDDLDDMDEDESLSLSKSICLLLPLFCSV